MRFKLVSLVLIALLSTVNTIFAMIPGYATIAECPHCKGTKELLSIMSGNTVGGYQWWDLKEDYPMLPHISYVQKCPHCGKYFILSTVKKTVGTDYSSEMGQLSYPELREALLQLHEMESGPARSELLLEYVWAYNDAFQRELKIPKEFIIGNVEPTEEEKEEFKRVIIDLISCFQVYNDLIHAEFFREAGMFEEAIKAVDSAGPQTEEPYKTLEKIIREKCASKDTRVGVVNFGKE